MKRERTIEEKQKDFRVASITSAIFLTVVVSYFCLTFQAYMSVYPDVNLIDAISSTFSVIMENPFYFWPIDYNCGITISVVSIMLMFSFINYTVGKMRLHHDVNTLKGSAKWADIKDFVSRYADFEKKDYRHAQSNIILSQNTQMSLNTKKHFHALNTLILGTTGSGKSRYILKPNLLQMNCSFVVTDPKGAILQECGEMMRRFGYNVKVFDLVDKGNCDTYNPLRYCYQEADVKKLVETFMANQDRSGGNSGGKDPFWDDATSAFLCACVSLLTSIPEGYDVPYAQIPAIMGGTVYEPVFANLCEFARMANKKWDKNSGIEPYEGVVLGDGKNNTANASELAMIFENLRMWESARQDLSPDEMEKPYCLREWENFKIAPEKTSTTILMTTATKLDSFNIEEIRNLTSSDTLDLNSFGQHRDALFIIIPATDRTYNFLAAFLYTQLFDRIYYNCEKKTAGSKNLYLSNGELVWHFSKEEVDDGSADTKVDIIKKAKIVKGGGEILHGHKTVKKKFLWITRKKKVPATFIDEWYDILDAEDNLISRRPTRALAEAYVKDLQEAKLKPGEGVCSPTHVRFLLDEFANIGKIPEFQQKLATMRGYEISCTVICQTITQLKGMYEKDWEVVDGNCPETIFLGGDDNTNNEYISKKIGSATVKGWNNSMDSKRAGSSSYNVEERALIKPDELGRMPFSDELVLIYGEQPIYDKKYDYPSHKNYKYTHDYACDIGCHNGSVFDRSMFEMAEPRPLTYKPEMPNAVPEVKPFSIDAFKQIFCAATVEDGLKKVERSYQRYSIEAGSVPGAY